MWTFLCLERRQDNGLPGRLITTAGGAVFSGPQYWRHEMGGELSVKDMDLAKATEKMLGAGD